MTRTPDALTRNDALESGTPGRCRTAIHSVHRKFV
jgi:hypothetical protein